MAKVIPFGQPANDSERKAIGFLRDRLPEGWFIFHNFEMRQGTEVFEIDIALLAPHALYLVDVKGTRGNIEVYGSKWYPEGRQPFHSPLAKLRNHAKIMAAIIRESNPGIVELRKVHVHATVLLTADDAVLSDSTGLDGPDVIDLKNCLRYFRDTSKVPAHRLNNISRFHSQISKTITGKAKAKNSALVFRDWQVEEKLGGTDRYTEYRAKHTLLGKNGGMARLRVYVADPYQEEGARQEEFKKISNAYSAVAHMPTHANILAVKDLFVNDDQDQVVLVTEDISGQALRLYINKSTLALTFDQKLLIMRDVLSALDHAHRYEVIHRNLNPDSILVTKGGQARVTGFDFARVGKNRTSTIAGQIIDDLDARYQAPECFRDPSQASIASDLFAAGLIFYELLTGEMPFESIDQMMDADGKFPIKPSEYKPDLPVGMDDWLQKFCEFDPEDRHISAAIARMELDNLILPESNKAQVGAGPAAEPMPEDLNNLPQDFILANRFRIQKKLGSGGFSVAYKVFDSLGDVVRVIKLVTKDRRSVYERLRREYKTLSNLPEHQHVVKVVWADRMTDALQTPYIVFEYVEGLDVADLIAAEALSLDDSIRIVREAASGLAHLHKFGFYHQDIKPSNLLWTDEGTKIIDFNVAVSEDDDTKAGGGTRRYLPPDYDYSGEPTREARIDRDLYALGITFYECLTGRYPFDEPTPPLKTSPKDPRQHKGCADLSSSLVDIVMKMIAPENKDRFDTVDNFLRSFAGIKSFRSIIKTGETIGGVSPGPKPAAVKIKPNTNPFVSQLLTLYSQSRTSNTGTRGLDEISKAIYVSTYLDNRLKPALINGDFNLVIISGNAGDGKTAFIQQFEAYAESNNAKLQHGANGTVFQIEGHTFVTNYDGSQDEGDERNDQVLQRFFSPFVGADTTKWPSNQTRIIAINEGRLVDFFLEHEEQYPVLNQHIQRGLSNGEPENRVAIINLNLRAVVANTDDGEKSILERLILQMIQPLHWEACENCDLRAKCYIYHNIKTFQDPKVGPKVIERLKMLYTITHLRGVLHVTMRDLRSALAFMLVGTRDCGEIHQIYQNGGEDNQNRILDGFYFNAWQGGREGSSDRLISLMSEIDVAQVSNPELDRELSFLNPEAMTASRFNFEDRPRYDEGLIDALFRVLPRDYSSKNRGNLITKHRVYLAHLRRRHFFERRDGGWINMLPYKSIESFLTEISRPEQSDSGMTESIIEAINRGEGLNEFTDLGNKLALRVRRVEKGSIRSYRLFDGGKFWLAPGQDTTHHLFLECLPQALLLHYDSGDGYKARLKINLDIYEMLMRLNKGYRPSLEEEEGFYLSLMVFKNALASAPYQEVLLTDNGYEFFQIKRDNNGILSLEKAKWEAEA